MTAPFEIIAAPFTVYFAPITEAFPDVDETPAGNWAKIGTSGDQNYSEDGVIVAHEQTIEQFRALGGTGPRKVSRTEENFIIRFTLWDILAEQYRHALNENIVTTVAAGSGTPGTKKVDLYQNIDVALIALLVRGDVSPEGAGWKTQYELPQCYQSASPEPAYVKGAPAGLSLEFMAIEDPNAAAAKNRFGTFVIQHQTAI